MEEKTKEKQAFSDLKKLVNTNFEDSDFEVIFSYSNSLEKEDTRRLIVNR